MSMLVAVILGLVGVSLILAGATNSAPNVLKVITGTGAKSTAAAPTGTPLTPAPHGGLF